ncbi:peptidylprolyl isomerase [Candidatus Pelagibacter sp.]|nr:peptidylprolyl isomerase [Candidatus Pelagibacter sp.]
MTKFKLKKIFLIIFIFFSVENNLFAKLNLEILYKINNEIVTNIDVENEKKFLIFLNPNLKNLSENQIYEITNKSIINRKIKEIELIKYINLNETDMGEDYIEQFITNSNFNNKSEFLNGLSNINLDYEYVRNNFMIDNIWREFIFNKFKSQVKVDVKALKEKLLIQKNEIEEINLSEILFQVDQSVTLEQLKNKIYDEINRSGFEAAATIYSISSSKNFGGKLGWIKSNQISDEIYSEIKNGESITNPIKTKNGYLILKINEKRKIKEEIDLENELKKLVNKEKDNELNRMGYIYFNKIKRRTFIDEK